MADKPIRFKVAFETKPEKEIPLTAFAFGSRGEFLASAPVDNAGQTDLPIPENQASGGGELIGGQPGLLNQRVRKICVVGKP